MKPPERRFPEEYGKEEKIHFNNPPMVFPIGAPEASATVAPSCEALMASAPFMGVAQARFWLRGDRWSPVLTLVRGQECHAGWKPSK